MSDHSSSRRDGLALLVLRRFRELGPMTVKDCANALAKPVAFIAPRVTELVHCGALVPDLDAGARRSMSGRGRPALLYRVNDIGRATSRP